jgi:uncharacterized membrane protein
MIFLTLATVFFGAALFLIKFSAPAISAYYANILFSLASLVVQTTVLLFVKIKGVPLHASPKGIWLALLGGAIIGLYTVFVFLSFSKLEITKVTPIVYAGAISLSSILGVVFLGETLGVINILGFVLVLGGIFLLFVK